MFGLARKMLAKKIIVRKSSRNTHRMIAGTPDFCMFKGNSSEL